MYHSLILTLRKIAIWMSKNCQKLSFFQKKMQLKKSQSFDNFLTFKWQNSWESCLIHIAQSNPCVSPLYRTMSSRYHDSSDSESEDELTHTKRCAHGYTHGALSRYSGFKWSGYFSIKHLLISFHKRFDNIRFK